jgi:hypothetical protein
LISYSFLTESLIVKQLRLEGTPLKSAFMGDTQRRSRLWSSFDCPRSSARRAPLNYICLQNSATLFPRNILF